MIWIKSVHSKLQKRTSESELPEIVSKYMNAMPIGGRLIAPLLSYGELVLVDFIKFVKFLSLSLLVQTFLNRLEYTHTAASFNNPCTSVLYSVIFFEILHNILL